MSRHGKSKGGRSHSDVPRKIVEPKISEPKPQGKALAAEATGAAKREDVLRQPPSPAPASKPKPAPVLAKTLVAPVPKPAAVLAKREEVVRQPHTPAPAAAKREELARQPQAPAPTPAKAHVAAGEANGAQPRALESAVSTIERSLQAASQGTVEVNRMLLDIGRQNVASGLDLARSLAAAKSPIEAARLHLAFWEERMKALLHQAEELRALSADLVAKANEPIREHMRSLRSRAG
jgi:hypothetical protein